MALARRRVDEVAGVGVERLVEEGLEQLPGGPLERRLVGLGHLLHLGPLVLERLQVPGQLRLLAVQPNDLRLLLRQLVQ